MIFRDLHIDSNDSIAHIARMIEDGQSVLDMGCGLGTLGSILKKFKKCSVDGIDNNYNYLAFAKKIL